MMNIQYAQSRHDIERCWEVVHELRPHLERASFADQVIEMIEEGYQLIYIEENDKPVAFAGFRQMQLLYSGKIIYIDDLGTLAEYRGRGYGSQLLDHIHQLALETGKKFVTLDSGYHRNTAHRLYLNKGYVLSSHHLSRSV